MSEEFEFSKYWNPRPARLERSEDDDFPLLRVLLRQEQEDHPILGLTNNGVLHRHYPSLDVESRIEIRQVRKIPLRTNFTNGLGVDRPDDEEPKVTVRTIRSFSRRSQTSCYWEDAGWVKNDEWLLGHYRAGRRQYRGAIELTGSTYEPFKFFIYYPPEEIFEGPHGACFHPRGDADMNKYWIHFSEQPADVDSGIIQVEHDLRETLGIR